MSDMQEPVEAVGGGLDSYAKMPGSLKDLRASQTSADADVSDVMIKRGGANRAARFAILDLEMHSVRVGIADRPLIDRSLSAGLRMQTCECKEYERVYRLFHICLWFSGIRQRYKNDVPSG